MFTMIGIGLIVLLAFLANREQNKDSACRSGVHARCYCRPHPLGRALVYPADDDR
jgi:hypothetical protein